MDLFALDKLIISFARKFMSDGVLQFATLIGLWLAAEVVLPSNKKKEKKK